MSSQDKFRKILNSICGSKLMGGCYLCGGEYRERCDKALSQLSALNKIDEETLIHIILYPNDTEREVTAEEIQSARDIAKTLIQRKSEWLG